MAGLRDIKRQARRDLHNEMRVPVLYLSTPTATPVPVGARVHSKFRALGDQPGTSLNSAEREEIVPRIIFFRSDLPAEPVRGAIVSVEAGEAYRVDVVLPADDQFVTVRVIQMTPTMLATSFPDGQPVPEA